jgi:predicted nucleic acid-binding protein
MSLLVDTGGLYPHHDVDATRHDVATTARSDVLRSAEYGTVLPSDYVYDERLTLTSRRTGRAEAATEPGRRLRGVDPYPDAIDEVYTTQSRFSGATERYDASVDHGLSVTNVVAIALVEHHDIDAVPSVDDGFDGLADRRDPTQSSPPTRAPDSRGRTVTGWHTGGGALLDV